MKKNRVFVDMDGVICEYKNVSEEELEEKGYFYNLAPRKSMVDAINCLIESNMAEVFVLSAVIPSIANQAKEEKNAWLDKYVPAIDKDHRIFTLCGESKVGSVPEFSKEDILLDDYSANLFTWHEAGGKAVKILNEINGHGGSFQCGPRLFVDNKEDLLTLL